jgi:hypothetical protein
MLIKNSKKLKSKLKAIADKWYLVVKSKTFENFFFVRKICLKK